MEVSLATEESIRETHGLLESCVFSLTKSIYPRTSFFAYTIRALLFVRAPNDNLRRCIIKLYF